MIKVSKLNLLGKRMSEIEKLQERHGFISRSFIKDKLFNLNRVVLALTIPHFELTRGEYFCKDIINISEGEIKSFSLDMLISVLVAQFLQEVRTTSLRSMYYRLADLKYKYDGVVSDFKRKGDNTLKRTEYKTKQKKVIYRILMKKDVALRGEILLFDLNEKYPDLFMTLEELISYLYMDFIESVRDGITKEVIEEITKVL